MTIKAVTFDVGSTLLFPQPGVAETFCEVCAGYGYDFTLDFVEQFMPLAHASYEAAYEADGDFWCHHEGCQKVWTDEYAVLADCCGVIEHRDAIIAEVYASFRRADHWGVYEDVVEALQSLSERGIAVGVVSNWDRELQEILEGLGLARYMSGIHSSVGAGLRKPDPRFFGHAVAQLGFAPHEVLHVGDLDDADGEGALNAGLQALIIDRKGGLHPGFRVIDDLRKICDYL